MEVFQLPDEFLESKDAAWTGWLHDQKASRPGFDLAIELQEDYNAGRVMGAASLILITLLVLSVVWLIEGGDAAYVSTVMSFVLGFLTGECNFQHVICCGLMAFGQF